MLIRINRVFVPPLPVTETLTSKVPDLPMSNLLNTKQEV